MIPIVIPYPVGGEVVEEKDVNFYDYDGTLVAGYTVAEAQALTALPDAPDHSADDVPLTFQEWNYTLAQVNATITPLDIGATYIPTDGKTHFIVRVTAVSGGALSFYFKKSNASDTLSIDYGDGQTDSNSADASFTFTPATALSVGDHHVTVWLSSGAGTFNLGPGASTSVLGNTDAQSLLKCFIGASTTLSGYSFYNDTCLSEVTIPQHITSIGTYSFRNCYSLDAVVFPKNVTSIATYAVNSCYSLRLVSIPTGITALADSSFQICSALPKISIPEGVTSIGSSLGTCYSLRKIILPSTISSFSTYSFYNNYTTLEYDFSTCTAVPTLSNINVFSGISKICIMKIPSDLYATWSTATNWSTYAAYMVEV